MDTVMIFGTFDRIHPGHLDFFRQARKHGDYMIAVIARDENVELLKGQKPRNNEQQRLENISKIPLIDHARLGHIDHPPHHVILEERPSVLCLGYDQVSFIKWVEEELKKNQYPVKIIRLKPYNEEEFKSSKMSPYENE